ncbi:MAG: CAP domain-containing protein [Candidatus Paceibacterota bacterium]
MTLFCNVAKASTPTVASDISNIIGFINNNVIAQIKKDFCNQYILSISSGDWKADELRTKIGKRVCTSYNIPSPSATKIAKDVVQPLNGNISIKTETPSTSSVNNPSPDVYVPDLSGGTDLNAGSIIYWTNLERKNNDSGLINLQLNNILKNIASIRVKDMFNYQYFEHNSPSGDNASKEAVKNGYSYITIGENIGLGNFDGSKGVVTAWMNSPGHRANILNKNYTEIGVYAEKGAYKGQSVWIAAQIFGKPISGCTEPDKTLKDKIAKYKVSAESLLISIKNIDAELKTISTTDTQTYNAKVAERNTLAGLYNNLASEIKTLVAEYNKQAGAFNLCIKTT